jgi:hypothetical protein
LGKVQPERRAAKATLFEHNEKGPDKLEHTRIGAYAHRACGQAALDIRRPRVASVTFSHENKSDTNNR